MQCSELSEELQEYFVLSGMTGTANCFEKESRSLLIKETSSPSVKELDTPCKSTVFNGAPRLVKRFVDVRSKKREWEYRFKILEAHEAKLTERDLYIEAITKKCQDYLQSSLSLIDVIESLVPNHFYLKDIETDAQVSQNITQPCNKSLMKSKKKSVAIQNENYKPKSSESQIMEPIIDPYRKKKKGNYFITGTKQPNHLPIVTDASHKAKTSCLWSQFQNINRQTKLLEDVAGISENSSDFQRHQHDTQEKESYITNCNITIADINLNAHKHIAPKSQETCDFSSEDDALNNGTDGVTDILKTYIEPHSLSRETVRSKNMSIDKKSKYNNLYHPNKSNDTTESSNACESSSSSTKNQSFPEIMLIGDVSQTDRVANIQHLPNLSSEFTESNCFKMDTEPKRVPSNTSDKSNSNKQKNDSVYSKPKNKSSSTLKQKCSKACDGPVLEFHTDAKPSKETRGYYNNNKKWISQYLQDTADQRGFIKPSPPFKENPLSPSGSVAEDNFAVGFPSHMNGDNEFQPMPKHHRRTLLTNNHNTISDIPIGTDKSPGKHIKIKNPKVISKTRKLHQHKSLTDSELSLNLEPYINCPPKSRKNTTKTKGHNKALNSIVNPHTTQSTPQISKNVPIQVPIRTKKASVLPSTFTCSKTKLQKESEVLTDAPLSSHSEEKLCFGIRKLNNNVLKHTNVTTKHTCSVARDCNSFPGKAKFVSGENEHRIWKEFWGPNTVSNSVSMLNNNPPVNFCKNRHSFVASQKPIVTKSSNSKTGWKKISVKGVFDSCAVKDLERKVNKGPKEGAQFETTRSDFGKHEIGDSAFIIPPKQSDFRKCQVDLMKHQNDKGKKITDSITKIALTKLNNNKNKNMGIKTLIKRSVSPSGKTQKPTDKQENGSVQSKSTYLNKSQFSSSIREPSIEVKGQEKLTSKARMSKHYDCSHPKPITSIHDAAKLCQHPNSGKPELSHENKKEGNSKSKTVSSSHGACSASAKLVLFQHEKDTEATSVVTAPVDKRGTTIVREILGQQDKVLVEVSEIVKPNFAKIRENGLSFEEYMLAFGYRPMVSRTPEDH